MAALAKTFKPATAVQGSSRQRPARSAVRLVPRAAGSSSASLLVDTRPTHDDLRARVVVAGTLALCRDFCAAVGFASMALGHAQDSAWLDGAAHDRLLLGVSNVAFALSVWRAGCLHTEVLQRFGALGSDAAHAHEAAGAAPAAGGASARAAAALAAMAWGASGAGLASAVSSQVHALHIQLLQKDATIMRLAKMLEDDFRSDK